jgi:glutamyl-Q tRNA(Asp) synthetase
VAALGSCLDARSRGGEWLLRMEDVDPPRVVAGAADRILRTLECHGFGWDGPVMWQGRRGEAYQAALEQLARAGQIYGCDCSRKRIAELGHAGVDGPVYPGTCRGKQARPGLAQRFLAPDDRVVFLDGCIGRVACDLAGECGDFVLRRADGVFTYQLAVVVDDAAQGITHVVRGADLLASSPRQIALQRALGYPTPHYAHLPVALDEQGCKLSKQTLAAPLDDARPLPALFRAAAFLGLSLESTGSVDEFWGQAIARWGARPNSPVRARRLSRRSCS